MIRDSKRKRRRRKDKDFFYINKFLSAKGGIMTEMSTCIFCGEEAVVESVSIHDAYQVECPCGKYISSEYVEQDFKDMDDTDRQAVSDFIKQCRVKNEIPELHILQGTGELKKIIEKMKKEKAEKK
jgi:stalled ribosome rescue protein Dom34